MLAALVHYSMEWPTVKGILGFEFAWLRAAAVADPCYMSGSLLGSFLVLEHFELVGAVEASVDSSVEAAVSGIADVGFVWV